VVGEKRGSPFDLVLRLFSFLAACWLECHLRFGPRVIGASAGYGGLRFMWLGGNLVEYARRVLPDSPRTMNLSQHAGSQ